MAFIEKQLNLGILYGTRGGRGFNTEVLTNAGGQEQRIIRWREPKGRWLLGNKRLTETELEELHSFFQARKGSYEGFRFKDWSDFEVKNGFIHTGDGTNTKFQLIKLYGSARRVITKPIADTLTIYLDGTPTTDYTLDISTGVIAFNTAPANGTTITADFEFDVPVRFEQDRFKSRFIAYSDVDERLHELADLSIVEIRMPRDNGDTDFKSEGIEFYGFDSQESGTVGVYRLYHTEFNTHFYTTSITERDNAINNDPRWTDEGIRFYVHDTQVTNSLPVYRFYNQSQTAYFYTISETERQDILNNSPEYTEEGVAWYAFDFQATNTVPAYRFFNSTTGGHFYTTSEAERNTLLPVLLYTPSVDLESLQSQSFNLNRDNSDQAIIYETIGGAEYKTTITPVGNGFERRDISWEGNRPRFNLGDFVLNKTEWEYLQQFFYERLGRGGEFLFSDYGYKNGSAFLARFDQDNLEVRFDGYDPFDGEKLFYLSGLQIVATTPIPEEVDPLTAPDTAQFYFIIDTTSIEQQQVDAINAAVTEFKPILRDEVFGGDQALADSNITVIESTNTSISLTGAEAWMAWFNDLYSADAYYFFWMDESNTRYHGTTVSDTDTAPTAEWNSDFDTFDSNFDSRNFFGCRLYHVSRNLTVNAAFEKHAQEAYFGLNGYTAVKDYKISLRFKVDATQLSATDYFNDFTGQSTIGLPPRLLRGYQGLFGTALAQATCWKIERQDGLILGFTNHDENLLIDGVIYRAETGISPTATTRKANLTQDNSKISSILDSNLITESDLIAGKYEEARITQASVDWFNPPATLEDGLILLKGKTGEVETTQYSYSAEVVGLNALLNRPVSETMTPLCRATFGDNFCQKDLTNLTATGVAHIDSAESTDLIIDTSAIALTEAELQDGKATAETGDNFGITRDIRSVDYSTGTIVFYEPFPFLLQTSDTFTLVAGCNKTFESCKGYNNSINFQGGPTHGNFFPNADWIFSSPQDD